MTTTITRAATVITPTMLLGYRAARPARNLLVSIIGRGDPDVVLQPAGTRTGTLELGFSSRTQAWACVTLHAAIGTLILADTDAPEINMTYVVSGDITPELEDSTRKLWLVTIGFQEVTP